MRKNKKWIDDPNSPFEEEWVQDNFADEFWGGLRSNPGKWVTVPLGVPRLDTAPIDMLTNIECKYQQDGEEFCLVFALASALHYVGLEEAAQKIASIAEDTTNMSPQDQVDVVQAHMVENAPSIGHTQKFGRFKRRKRGNFDYKDLIKEITKYPTIVIPVGQDGSTNHAVCIVDDLVFDSTQKFALKLQFRSFDWVVGCEGGLESFYGAIRFCLKVKKDSPVYEHEIQSNW